MMSHAGKQTSRPKHRPEKLLRRQTSLFNCIPLGPGMKSGIWHRSWGAVNTVDSSIVEHLDMQRSHFLLLVRCKIKRTRGYKSFCSVLRDETWEKEVQGKGGLLLHCAWGCEVEKTKYGFLWMYWMLEIFLFPRRFLHRDWNIPVVWSSDSLCLKSWHQRSLPCTTWKPTKKKESIPRDFVHVMIRKMRSLRCYAVSLKNVYGISVGGYLSGRAEYRLLPASDFLTGSS